MNQKEEEEEGQEESVETNENEKEKKLYEYKFDDVVVVVVVVVYSNLQNIHHCLPITLYLHHPIFDRITHKTTVKRTYRFYYYHRLFLFSTSFSSVASPSGAPCLLCVLCLLVWNCCSSYGFFLPLSMLSFNNFFFILPNLVVVVLSLVHFIFISSFFFCVIAICYYEDVR